MSAISGVSPILTYDGANPAAKVQQLIDIIPNPDASHGAGAVAGGSQGILNTWLDEMSPGAAAQLRVELIALKAAVPAV